MKRSLSDTRDEMGGPCWPEGDRRVSEALGRPIFRAADLATAGFLVFLMVLTSFRYPYILGAGAFLAAQLAVLVLVVLSTRVPVVGGNPLAAVVRKWFPVFVIPTMFYQLGAIIPGVVSRDGDRILIGWDLFLFGGHPSVWMEKIYAPALTEWLQYVYSSFYFFPLAIAGYLVAKGREEAYDYFLFVVTYGFFFSYLGYFLVPAIGPLTGIHHQYHFQLEGVWGYAAMVDLQHSIERVHRDCFPSGHTMMTLAFLHFAWKFTRPLFWVLAPVGSMLIFSTVYLRYHYGVDLLAGVSCYLFLVFSAPRLYRMWLGSTCASRGIGYRGRQV